LKRDEVTGKWRKHPNKDWMGRPYSSDGERRGMYRVLVEKPDRKKPLGRPRHRWEDNIKMDLQ
jgi:hypothetical protein